MAKFNPFHRFRQNQTAAFAILAVLAMVSFIVLPIVMQLISGIGHSEQSLVAKCRRFGEVSIVHLDRLRNNREAVSRFYFVLQQNLEANAPLTALQEVVQEAGMPRDDEDLVNDWLLTQHGLAQGMTASEEAIFDYLKRLTTGSTNATAALKKTLADIGISRRRLNALLADTIVLSEVQQVFQHNLPAITPSMRWNAFERLGRRVRVEATAIPVASFIKEVSDPSREELQAFFAANRYRQPHPDQAESGFAIPRKLAFAYLVIAPTEEMMAAISADEVQKYYDENKATLFRKPLTRDTSSSPPAPSSISIVDDSLVFPTLPSLPTAPNTNLPTDAPSEPAPKESVPEELYQLQYISHDFSDGEGTETQTPANEIGEVGIMKITTATEEEETVIADSAAQIATPQEIPQEIITAPEIIVTVPDGTLQDETAQDEKLPDETPLDLDAIFFRPLAEVEAQIRHTLAQEKLNAASAEIEAAMRKYLDEYTRRGDTATPLDLAALAAQHKFEYITTGVPISFFETRALSIAADFAGRQLLQQHYERPPVHFEPQRINGQNATFLLWVTATEQIRYPDFAEVEDTVRQRYREVAARALARKQAEELARRAEQKCAEQPGGTLAEVLADSPEIRVVQTEFFAWKTYGDPYMALQLAQWGIPPRLGDVCEQGISDPRDNQVIHLAGNEWMEKAYSLDLGKIGVTMNQPQTEAYVIRLLETTPEVAVLMEGMRNAKPYDFDTSLYRDFFRATYQRFMLNVQQQAGFEWVMPESMRRRSGNSWDD